MIRVTPSSNQPVKRPRIKGLQIQIPGHTERKEFLSGQAKCHSYSVLMWINRNVISVLCTSKTFLCWQLYLKIKKKRKTKQPQVIIEAMVMYLSSPWLTLFWSNLSFFYDHSPTNIFLQFWSFHGNEKGKDKRNKQNCKYYLLSQQSSMV